MSHSVSSDPTLRPFSAMASATNSARIVPSSALNRPFEHELQQKLLLAISGDQTPDEAIACLLVVLRQVCNPTSILYCHHQNGRRDLKPAPELSPPETGRLQSQFQSVLIDCCTKAAETAALQISELGPKGCLVAIAVPVLLNGVHNEAIGVVLPAGSCDRHTVAGTLQIVASHVTLWHVLETRKDAEAESNNSAALLELLAKCDAAPSPKEACFILTNELRTFLKCNRVAIGLCGYRTGVCQLQAVSGASRFDHRSDLTNSLEAALDEAILRERTTIWPSDDDVERVGSLAHARACDLIGASSVVGSPLRDEKGSVVGAWLVFGDVEQAQIDDIRDFLLAAGQQVGSSLALLRRATENPFSRQFRQLLKSWRVGYGVLCCVLLVALMLLPVRYKIGCDCQVQPVTRRFVSAPYDGKLETAFVKPGDEVTEGDLLARLDGRELRWEMAGLEADFSRALKSRDSAMAIDNIADSQQKALEMERLQLKIQLCRNRLDNLEIKSPVSGLVISGDLKKTEGAPVAVGQTLFEIAPLDQMIVECEIPEREILYARPNQPVVIRVDAYPLRKWTGEIARIFPKAEVRENASVYVAEMNLDNRSGEFRPGMKGRAKITSERRALGWTLFHRPFESLCMSLGW